MGMPCAKYFTVMLPIWLPLLQAAGDLDQSFATGQTIDEIESMSPATIDRYLAPARHRMQVRGIPTTTPAPALLRNSIRLSKTGDTRACCAKRWQWFHVLTTSPTASSLNSGEYSLRLLARLNILSWKGATKRGQGQ